LCTGFGAGTLFLEEGFQRVEGFWPVGDDAEEYVRLGEAG
jgi:hypothetical protein